MVSQQSEPGSGLYGGIGWVVRSCCSAAEIWVGNIQPKFGTNLLHTDTDIPGGVRAEAMRLGYGGGSSMSFLRLQNMAFPAAGHPVIAGLGQIPNALSEASNAQRTVLEGFQVQLEE